jgi:hypothetical protein
MTSEFNIPPAFACYRLGKAEAYLRKAQAELENLELINERFKERNGVRKWMKKKKVKNSKK